MDWVIVVLVCLGLAFDVFSIAVSQGSVLGKVRFRGLVFMCLIVWAWQLVTLSIGYGITALINVNELQEEIRNALQLVASTIFVGCGGIKIFLVQRRKAVPEELSDINLKKLHGIAAPISIYTFFVALGCGFLTLRYLNIFAIICVMTIAIVIWGVFVGYRNGELNKKMYWAGGIFLIGAGALVVTEYITNFISG
jgi:putative Mn2+ efflux pump MntP